MPAQTGVAEQSTRTVISGCSKAWHYNGFPFIPYHLHDSGTCEHCCQPGTGSPVPHLARNAVLKVSVRIHEYSYSSLSCAALTESSDDGLARLPCLGRHAMDGGDVSTISQSVGRLGAFVCCSASFMQTRRYLGVVVTYS